MKRDFGVGQRIREARKALGLTQDKFARAIRASKPALVRYEAGRRLPRPEILQRIAHVTDKPIAWFFSGEVPYAGQPQRSEVAAQESPLAEPLRTLALLLESERTLDAVGLSRLPPRHQRRFLERLKEVQQRLKVDLERLKTQLQRELIEYQRLLEAEWASEREKRR